MFDVLVKYNDFTASVTIDDACYTDSDIKDAFLEIAENNSIENFDEIIHEEIEIDYSGLPTWLDETDLPEFFDNYPNAYYDDLDIWEAAKDCGIGFDSVDEAYNGQWNSDEEFVKDLLEQTGDLPSDLPSYIHIDWETTAHEVMYDYAESNGHYFRYQ